MEKKKKMIVLCLAAVFFLFCAGCWLRRPQAVSVSERRKLAQFPKLTAQNLLSGSFMDGFEKYAADQFPFRDGFRTVKALASEKLMYRRDNNGIYVTDGTAVKMEYPLNETSVSYAAECFDAIYENCLRENGNLVYFAVVPDKNYFAAEKSGHLRMDYERLFSMMKEKLPYMEMIDLTECLEIEDYYAADVHWRQEKIVDSARKIGERMGITLTGEYEVKTLAEPFYGVYHGQSALPLPAEKLHYLTNETLEKCRVKNYENGAEGGVYDFGRAKGNDPYEIFLSGPVSLLTIENPSAETDRELIIFRDSFGSSLAPLLAEGYAKITLADIRYFSSRMLKDYIDFTGKDVLFLYSTTVLNHSETMKK